MNGTVVLEVRDGCAGEGEYDVVILLSVCMVGAVGVSQLAFFCIVHSQIFEGKKERKEVRIRDSCYIRRKTPP